jgi:hypothetical protein
MLCFKMAKITGPTEMAKKIPNTNPLINGAIIVPFL